MSLALHGGDRARRRGTCRAGAARKSNGHSGGHDGVVHGVPGDRADQDVCGKCVYGPVYRARVTAVSDEWLLDNLGSGAGLRDAESLGLGGTALVAQMASRAQAGGSAGVTVGGFGTVATTGAFAARASSPFSVNAANAASSAYAAYRALNGQILMQPVGNVTHAFSDANGTLSVSELQTSAVRELANDVTLTGAEEPAAYIEENFFGDGTTTVFDLSEAGLSRYQSHARFWITSTRPHSIQRSGLWLIRAVIFR